MAKLVAFSASAPRAVLGVAKGKFEVPGSIDNSNAEIAELFTGQRS